MNISTDLWTNPAFVGLVIALPATAIGYLGYRRSRNLDRVAEQAGIATTNVTSIGQVVDGLNKVIDNIRTDNDDLRKEIRELRQTVRELNRRIDELERMKTTQ